MGHRVRAGEEATLERVRWEVSIGTAFDERTFDEACAGFRRLYHARPERVLCAPDVLERCATLFARSANDAHVRNLRFDGIPLVGAIVAPGTVVFEGEVDEERMGDW